MVERRHGGRTIARQFLLLQLIVLGLVLVAVAVVTVQQSTHDFRSTRGARMLAVAETLANTGVVRSTLTEGELDDPRAVEAEIARAASLSGARRVIIVDADGGFVAASEPALSSPRPPLGIAVSEGRSWTGDLALAGNKAVAGQAPVINNEGRTVGAVLVAEDYPPWWTQLRDAAPDLLLYLGIAALLGVSGSYAISRLIRRQTRGLEPAAIAQLADYQEALLRGIHEGVIGINASGHITVLNDKASDLLGVPAAAGGTPVTEHHLPGTVTRFLLEQTDSDSTVFVLGGRVLVLNRRRAMDDGRFVGTVTTLVDRSDLVALESQIAAQASITETLRAQTHEFDNRLHTISGLLELQEYDVAVDLINEFSQQRTDTAAAITEKVYDPRVAALLGAKTSVAAEAGITLRLEPTSDLPKLTPEHAADILSVLGNLVDNALDATRGHGSEVTVWITHGRGRTTVRVSDSGPGMDPDHLELAFERGWSTKDRGAVGRGVGLALVRAICHRSGGSVEAVNGEEGAVLTAIVGREPGETDRSAR